MGMHEAIDKCMQLKSAIETENLGFCSCMHVASGTAMYSLFTIYRLNKVTGDCEFA